MSDTGKTRGALLLENGAVGFPSLAAYARQGDGMWFNSTGIHFSVAGTEVFSIASTGPAPVGSLLLNNGTAAAPSLAFLSAGNNNTGLFLKAADALGFAADGVEIGSYSAAGLFTLGPSASSATHVLNGGNLQLAGTAVFAIFRSAQDTGIVLNGDNTISSGGQIAVYGSTHATLASQVHFRNGTTVNGSISNAGLFTIGAAAGTQIHAINGSLGITKTAGIGGATDASAILKLGATNPLTGATQVGAWAQFTSTSAVSSSTAGFRSSLNTAASFVTPIAIGAEIDAITHGGGGSITKVVGLYAEEQTQGVSNAMIADNFSFSGAWAINLVSANPSLLSGNLAIKKSVAVATSTINTFAQLGVGDGTSASNPLTGTTQMGLSCFFLGTTAATTQVRGFNSSIGTGNSGSPYTTALAAQFISNAVTKGTNSTITHAVGLWLVPQTVGDNNADISDSNVFTGNWSLYLSNSTPALLSGALHIANQADPGAVTNKIAIGSVDIASSATLALRTETAVVSETVVSDATLTVQINGTTYKICLKA